MINLENVSKKFGSGTLGLSNISFQIEKGEFVFLVGATGSGKTTVLRLLIKESIPTEGVIVVNGWDLNKLPNKKIPELRKKVGVVFQDLKLLKDRTILENTILPLEVAGMKTKDAIVIAEQLLNQVGILDQKDKFPSQVSGGEKQRAAIARALILSPDILLADEPTGDLDQNTAWEIIKLLSEINERGTTIVMATHDAEIVKKLNKRVIELNKGVLINDKNGTKSHKKHADEDEKKHDEKHSQEHEKKDQEKPEDKIDEDKSDVDDKTLKTDDFEEALK